MRPEPLRRIALMLFPFALLLLPVRAAVWVHEVSRGNELARVGHLLHLCSGDGPTM